MRKYINAEMFGHSVLKKALMHGWPTAAYLIKRRMIKMRKDIKKHTEECVRVIEETVFEKLISETEYIKGYFINKN